MIEGLHFVRKRLADGTIRWYVYAWRGGPQIMSADGPRRPMLTSATIETFSKEMASAKAASQPDPNTLLSLIRQWRSADPSRPSSPEWDKLSSNTKKTWGSALDRIEEKWGDVPLVVFNDKRMIQKVIEWRDSRRDTPRGADLGIDVLKALLKFGIPRTILERNVAAGIPKLYSNGQRAEIVWTQEDLQAFTVAAGKQDADVDDAVQFASLTGLRRDDLTTVTMAAIRQFVIIKRANKESRGKRRFATIPRIPDLDALLARLATRPRAEGVDTVLVTSQGHPWHPDTLSKKVAKIAKKAGIAHVEQRKASERPITRSKHLHDVRGTFATRLMTTTDLTDEEIADIMGWSPDEVKRIRIIYVDDHARNVAVGRRIAGGV